MPTRAGQDGCGNLPEPACGGAEALRHPEPPVTTPPPQCPEQEQFSPSHGTDTRPRKSSEDNRPAQTAPLIRRPVLLGLHLLSCPKPAPEEHGALGTWLHCRAAGGRGAAGSRGPTGYVSLPPSPPAARPMANSGPRAAHRPLTVFVGAHPIHLSTSRHHRQQRVDLNRNVLEAKATWR